MELKDYKCLEKATINMPVSTFLSMHNEIESLKEEIREMNEDMDRTADRLIQLYPNLFTEELFVELLKKD